MYMYVCKYVCTGAHRQRDVLRRRVTTLAPRRFSESTVGGHADSMDVPPVPRQHGGTCMHMYIYICLSLLSVCSLAAKDRRLFFVCVP